MQILWNYNLPSFRFNKNMKLCKSTLNHNRIKSDQNISSMRKEQTMIVVLQPWRQQPWKNSPFLILQFYLGFAIYILALDCLPVKSWLFDLIFLFFGVQVTEEESRSTVVWVNTFTYEYIHIYGWTPSHMWMNTFT